MLSRKLVLTLDICASQSELEWSDLLTDGGSSTQDDQL